MQPVVFIPDTIHQFVWLAGFIFACFVVAALVIVWGETNKREAAEHDAAAAANTLRVEWRPLNTTVPRAFRPVKFKPSFTAKQPAPATPSPRARVLEGDLRRAVYIEPEQFTTTFETYYAITTHTAAATRATPHWQHPSFGFIDAEEFLPIANALSITKAVYATWLRAALVAYKKTRGFTALYVPLPAAVANWVDAPRVLRAVCASCSIEPATITFCVTEAGDYNVALALRAQGFGLALDDCRAVTHAALQRLPLTAVIADATLTRNVHTSPAAYAMIETIATLGHTLGIALLANDVDSAADATALRDAGFDLAGGTFFTSLKNKVAA